MSAVSSAADVAEVLGELVRRAADLQEQHPGYYRLTEVAPERSESPAHLVRERLIALSSAALRRAGVATPAAELHDVVGLCIETVRHTHAQHPAGDPGRESSLAEVELMLRAHLAARLR